MPCSGPGDPVLTMPDDYSAPVLVTSANPWLLAYMWLGLGALVFTYVRWFADLFSTRRDDDSTTEVGPDATEEVNNNGSPLRRSHGAGRR